MNQSADDKAKWVLQRITELLDGLTKVWLKAIDERDVDGAIKLLQQWKEETSHFLRDHVSDVEARELQRRTRNFPPIRHEGDLDFRIAKYEEILKALAKEIQDDPTILPITPVQADVIPTTTQDNETFTNIESSTQTRLAYANELYNKVKKLIGDTIPLDENTARIIVESADDAIKEFGNTNQEKKVELKQIKEQAEDVLPPKDVEELRKRAEGKALKKIHPTNHILRNILYGVIILILIVVGLLVLRKAVSGDKNALNVSPSPIPLQSQTPSDISPTPIPKSTPTSSTGPTAITGQSIVNGEEEARIAAEAESYSPMSIDEYFSRITDKNITDLQLKELRKELTGKTVIWTGKIIIIDSDYNNDISVSVIPQQQPSDRYASAYLKFDASQRADFLKLTQGRVIRFTGVVTRYRSYYPFLEKCRLLQVIE